MSVFGFTFFLFACLFSLSSRHNGGDLLRVVRVSGAWCWSRRRLSKGDGWSTFGLVV